MELRKRGKVQVRVVEEDESPEARDDFDTTDTAEMKEPARKKRKNTAKKPALVGKKNGRAGKLALLLHMPIEIFTEIASYVTPGDLLNLARTSSGLREILTSKSSKRVWEASRTMQDIGIPPCPSDVSELQYADLLFGKGCSLCADTRTKSTYVPIRIRLCDSCALRNLINASENDINLHLRIVRLEWVMPQVKLNNPKSARRGDMLFVLKPQFEKLKQKLKELEHDQQNLHAFLVERETMTNAINDSSLAIEQWIQSEVSRKHEYDRQILNHRHACIVARLRDLGYEEEDLETDYNDKGCKWNKLVFQTHPLTERVWQNIKPQLEEIVKMRRDIAEPRRRSDRCEERRIEMKTHFKKFKPQLKALPFGRIFSKIDFFRLLLVKDTMEENEFRLPVTEERWNIVANSLPRFVSEHLKEFERCCVKWVIEASRPTSDATTTSSLNTEVDSQLDSVDENKIPKCLLVATSLFGSVSTYYQLLQDKGLYCAKVNRYLISPNKQRATRELFSMAENLLEYLKLPKNTTMSYMIACGSDFRCTACSRISERNAMSWPKLVGHFVAFNEEYSRMLKVKTMNRSDTPLRNAHDLKTAQNALVERTAKTTVDLSPTFEPAGCYSDMSSSWGCRLKNKHAEDSVKNKTDGEVEEKDDDKPLGQRTCQLCKSLRKFHHERNRRGMRKHMKLCHGTDLEGNILPQFREPEQLSPSDNPGGAPALQVP